MRLVRLVVAGIVLGAVGGYAAALLRPRTVHRNLVADGLDRAAGAIRRRCRNAPAASPWPGCRPPREAHALMGRRLAALTLDTPARRPRPVPSVRPVGARAVAAAARRGGRRHRLREGGVGLGDAAGVGLLRAGRLRRRRARGLRPLRAAEVRAAVAGLPDVARQPATPSC